MDCYSPHTDGVKTAYLRRDRLEVVTDMEKMRPQNATTCTF